jgi:[NiFe] hydrogenase diaphorase moiety large subunit
LQILRELRQQRLWLSRDVLRAVAAGLGVSVAHWSSEWSRVDDHIQLADVKLADQSAPCQGSAAALARGPQGMLDDIECAKLRGRGGAGYTTGTKWQLCRNTRSDVRYVVCNADEVEPGTFKDRVLLSSCADAVLRA